MKYLSIALLLLLSLQFLYAQNPTEEERIADMNLLVENLKKMKKGKFNIFYWGKLLGKSKVKIKIKENTEKSDVAYDVTIYSSPFIERMKIKGSNSRAYTVRPKQFFMEDRFFKHADNPRGVPHGIPMVIAFEDEIIIGHFIGKEVLCAGKYQGYTDYTHFAVKYSITKNDQARSGKEVAEYLSKYYQEAIKRNQELVDKCNNKHNNRMKWTEYKKKHSDVVRRCEIFIRKYYYNLKSDENLKVEMVDTYLKGYKDLDLHLNDKEYLLKHPSKSRLVDDFVFWEEILFELGKIKEKKVPKEELYAQFKKAEEKRLAKLQEIEALSKTYLNRTYTIYVNGYSGKDGEDGTSGKNYYDGILSAELNGQSAKSGSSGTNGANVLIYCDVVSEKGQKWLKTTIKYSKTGEEQDINIINKMFDLSSENKSKIYIKANGGDGGDGGNGGNGGSVNISFYPNASPGLCGDGGSAGYGGDGGDVVIYHTPAARSYIEDILEVENKGGKKGYPGLGGSFSESKFDYLKGKSGEPGKDGKDGKVIYKIWDNPSFEF